MADFAGGELPGWRVGLDGTSIATGFFRREGACSGAVADNSAHRLIRISGQQRGCCMSHVRARARIACVRSMAASERSHSSVLCQQMTGAVSRMAADRHDARRRSIAIMAAT
jgi:hypothetical protein